MKLLMRMLLLGLMVQSSSAMAMDIQYTAQNVVAKRATLRFEKGAMDVTMPPNQAWPCVKIQGPWDFSEFAQMQATVKNTGENHIRLTWQLNNTGYNGVDNCSVNRFNLDPGEERVLTIMIRHKIKASDAVQLKGMKSIPAGLPKLNGIDPSKVTSMMFFAFKSRVEK